MRTKFVLPVILLVLISPALAIECPSVPDDADTRYVENAERRAVCLNNQLNGSSNQIELNNRIMLQDRTIQRLQLQNRFDRLPRFGE